MAATNDETQVLEDAAGGNRVAGRLARTYAESLLTVAEARQQVDAVTEQFDSLFVDVFQASAGLESYLYSPSAGRKKKDELLTAAFAGRGLPLFVDFLHLLNRKDRLSLLRKIAVAYRNLRETKANRQRVLVKSAAPLTESQLEALRQTLAASLGKTPILVVQVTPELIGGLVVQVGDKVFDTSVRSHIQALRTQLMTRGTHEIQSGRDRFGHN